MQSPSSDFSSQFGTYTISNWRNLIRRLGRHMPATKAGLLGASALRRLTLMGHKSGLEGPYDIRVTEHINARVFPASNRCEKRAFCGVQTWDAKERNFIAEAIGAYRGDCFTFVDVGANVGFYTLFAHHYAKISNQSVKLLAIEPDPENRKRLEFNVAVTGADVTIDSVAVSTAPGEGMLSVGEKNRGSIGLIDGSPIDGTPVKLEPLASIVTRRQLSHVDMMKVDIEGHDFAALSSFFIQAPKKLYPKKLIVETGSFGQSDIVDLALANGYEQANRTKMNAMMVQRQNG